MLKLQKQMNKGDSTMVNCIPAVNGSIDHFKWSIERMITIFLGVLTIMVTVVLALSGLTYYKADITARNTAKDEFNRAFKEYHDEIRVLAADAREKHAELTTIYKMSKTTTINDYDEIIQKLQTLKKKEGV